MRVTWIIASPASGDRTQDDYLHPHHQWAPEIRTAILFDQMDDATAYAVSVTDRDPVVVLKHVILVE